MTTTYRIDPQEMTAAAGTLRQCATETTDIGAGLTACISCPMPPEVAGVLNDLVRTADRVIQELVIHLAAEADDLVRRAAIASTDIATAGTASNLVGGNTFSSTIGSGSIIDGSTIGGGGGFSDSFRVVDPNTGQEVQPIFGSAIIGGTSSPTIRIIDPTTGLEVTPSFSGTIGGGWSNPLLDAIERRDANVRRGIDSIMSNPNSSEAARIAAGNIAIRRNDHISSLLAPSRSDMERKVGYTLTRAQYLQMVPNGII